MTSDIKEKIKMSKIEQLIGEIEEFIDGWQASAVF